MRQMTSPSVRQTPRPPDDCQELFGGYTRRQKHNARHGVVEYYHGAVLHRYAAEPPCQDYLGDGHVRRHAHPTNLAEIDAETLEDVVIVADRQEVSGAMISNRYRR